MQIFTIRRRVVTASALVLLAVTTTTFAQSNGAAPPPPAVRKAFEQSYPGATILSVTQTRGGNLTVFRVESTDKGRRRVLLYEAGGRAVEVSEEVTEKDLPTPVADAMHSHPRAIYGSGWKVTRGGSVEYHLTLKGTRKTAMIARPDGTVVSFK
jgi:hypothetical protein